MASATAREENARKRRLALRATQTAGVAAALTMLMFAAMARLAPRGQHGQLLPFFEDYEVFRVRLFGAQFYVDTSSGVADLLTVTALAGAACTLGVVALVLARRHARPAGTFAVGAAGAAFLAADDLLGAHESVGHNLGIQAALPIVEHPHDAIIGLYAVIGVTFAWRHRRLAEDTPRWPWLVGAAAGTFAVVHDLLPLHLGWAEEAAEVIAGVAGLIGVCCVAANLLSGSPRSPRRGRVAPRAARTLFPASPVRACAARRRRE